MTAKNSLLNPTLQDEIRTIVREELLNAQQELANDDLWLRLSQAAPALGVSQYQLRSLVRSKQAVVGKHVRDVGMGVNPLYEFNIRAMRELLEERRGRREARRS